MPETTRSQPKRVPTGCLVGCGFVGLLGLTLVGGGFAYFTPMMRQFDHAIEDRATLTERFGEQDAFRPPIDGAIAPDRLETYLQIRRELHPYCARFDATLGALHRASEREDPTFSEGFKLARSAMGLGPLLGDYMSARNRALLEHEMGFGEYTWIHILAIHAGPDRDPPAGAGDSHQGAPLEGDSVASDAPVRGALRFGRRGRVGSRALDAFERILQAWNDEIVASGATPPEQLTTELARERRSGQPPFAEGLPPAIAASLEPSYPAIEELRCIVAEDLELSRNRRQGISIHSD